MYFNMVLHPEDYNEYKLLLKLHISLNYCHVYIVSALILKLFHTLS